LTSLPSLRALDRAQGARIWLAAEAADMRCGFDRLAEWVRAVIGQDPLGGHLFVFRSRRGDRLKILVWDRDGFVRKRQTNGRLTGAIDSRYRRRAAAGARE
jgi:transposase